jgi:ribosome-binding protein aMBF1 (putative translation factor)
MGGTKKGGIKAYKTITNAYGEDFYASIGALGGAKGKADGTVKGFAQMPTEKVRMIGRMGGSISRKGDSDKLSKHKVERIKLHYNQQIRLMREQSEMSVNRLSAKHGVKRSW